VVFFILERTLRNKARAVLDLLAMAIPQKLPEVLQDHLSNIHDHGQILLVALNLPLLML
jgi:hypothetical protein